jgi:hypothetical protein
MMAKSPQPQPKYLQANIVSIIVITLGHLRKKELTIRLSPPKHPPILPRSLSKGHFVFLGGQSRSGHTSTGA